MGRAARKRREPVEAEARVESLDQDGRGVARVNGKVTFIDGALPGEHVRIEVWRQKRSFDEARTLEVFEASAERVQPGCPHFGLCGGCSLQHLSEDAQIRHKQVDLLGKLRHLGGVTPERVGEPLRGPTWGYRRKARLGCKHVPGKGGVLVGFRERRAHLIAQIDECRVLVPEVGMRIRALRDLLSAMDARDAIPQIEVAAGEGAVLLVLRNLAPLGDDDRARLEAFAREHDLHVALQPAGPDSVTALYPPQLPELGYRLPGFDLELRFSPLDFVQVNAGINASLVTRAVDWLAPAEGESVLDLFCGLGNFSLALARRGARVMGVEMGAEMVIRGRENARRNGLEQVRFAAGDLSQPQEAARWIGEGSRKVLLDPPRSGAEAVVAAIRDAAPGLAPQTLVYVSCNPATLARDAGVLVNESGYRLARVSVVDMFPHTNHLESMALFERMP